MARADRTDEAAALDIVERFETYEDYLDSQLTTTDMNYLGDEEMARQLVELNYTGLGNCMKREDFEAQKKMLLERSNQKHVVQRKLASIDKDLSSSAFLQALAEREELLRSGKLTTILFIRDKNGKVSNPIFLHHYYGHMSLYDDISLADELQGHEVSGYIDLAHRMRTEDFSPIFELRKKLLPKPSDLSYYNWETQLSTSNSSPLYQVIADSAQGLLFKNKRDRKIINVNPECDPGDNTSRTELSTKEYEQVVFYDHSTRRRL